MGFKNVPGHVYTAPIFQFHNSQFPPVHALKIYNFWFACFKKRFSFVFSKRHSCPCLWGMQYTAKALRADEWQVESCIPFPVESRLLQNHLFYEWVRLQTLGAKSAEKTIRNTGHSCSRQPAETDKHKEDELREYRREEMKTKIETWKCFVPAINKFGHVYILSYPCHVKIITSLRTLWHKISSMLAKRFLGSLLLIKHHKEKTNENSE